MKRIMVTGALGHIGSALIRQLPTMFPGCEVVMIDNLSTQRYSSLFLLPKGGQYRFLEADILDLDFKTLLDDVDLVIHLAAITNAEESVSQKEKVEAINLEGTKRIAEACVMTDTALLFPSTTSVYGKSEGWVDEGSKELQPQSPYAESKIKAEEFLKDLPQFPYVILRLGTIFGPSPGMRFHTAVNKFCWQAVLGQPITVWKTALHQSRPYLDLKDALRAFEFVIRKNLFEGETYNVVTTNTTVDSLIKFIERKVEHVELKYVDTEIMNQLSYQVNSDRIKKAGFKYQGSLDQGIEETIQTLIQANKQGLSLFQLAP